MSERKHVFSSAGGRSLNMSEDTALIVETDSNNSREEMKSDLRNGLTCQNTQRDPKSTKYEFGNDNDNDNDDLPGSDDGRADVTGWDIFCLILTVFSFPYDYVSDIYVTIYYFLDFGTTYGILTLVLIVIPGVTRTLISYHMRRQDKKNVQSQKKPQEKPQEKPTQKTNFEKMVEQDPCIILLVLSLFKLSPCLYHLRCLCYALRVRTQTHGKNDEKSKGLKEQEDVEGVLKLTSSRQKSNTHGKTDDESKFLREQEDAALLSILGCFLEAAPQLILQLHILWMEGLGITKTWCKIVGSCITLIVLAWSSKSYHCNMRKAQHNKAMVTRTGGVFLFFWCLGMTISRISLILIALRMSILYTLLACMIIWIGWTAWMYKVKDGVLDFCQGKTGSTETTVMEKIGSLLFSAVLSVVYFFMFVSLVDGPTFRRYLFYYILWVLQIVAVLVLWFSCKDLAIKRDRYSIAILILSVVSFVIGIACMMIYYQFLHPTLNTKKYIKPVTNTAN